MLAAIVAGGVAVWHQWSQGRQAISYFGTHSAYQIRHAARVEWEKTAAEDGENGFRDISKVPGLVHFRQALIEDASYAGQVPLDQANPTWQYAVIFRDDRDLAPTRVLLDPKNGWVGLPGQNKVLAAQPIASGISRFFADIEQTAR